MESSSAAFCTLERLGPHLDAPNHFEMGQLSVDEIELAQLAAPLAAVDMREACQVDSDYEFSLLDVRVWEGRNGTLARGAVVVAWTGWGHHWEDSERYKNADPATGGRYFPGFSAKAARLLI